MVRSESGSHRTRGRTFTPRDTIRTMHVNPALSCGAGPPPGRVIPNGKRWHRRWMAPSCSASYPWYRMPKGAPGLGARIRSPCGRGNENTTIRNDAASSRSCHLYCVGRAAGCFDALAVHDYGYGLSPEDERGTHGGLNLARILDLHDVMLEYGDVKPV